MPSLQKEGRHCKQPQSSSRHRPIKVAHQLQEDRDPTSEHPEAEGTLHVKEYPLYYCTDGSSKPILVKVTANGAELQMEVDTGATSSMRKHTRRFGQLKIVHH